MFEAQDSARMRGMLDSDADLWDEIRSDAERIAARA
jgi:hypothetical protein